MTATLNVSVDSRTAKGIEDILRAVEDVRAGRLICTCTDCELQRMVENA